MFSKSRRIRIMEISFKWPSFCFCLLCFQLCNGNPAVPGSKEIDYQTKFLTGIISLLLTVCCLVFIAACLFCRRKQAFEKFQNSPVGYSSSSVDHGHVNPIANGEFTIFSPLSTSPFNNNIFHPNDERNARTVENSTESAYDIKSWFGQNEEDFPRNKLKYIKELGTGWFGKVVQGAAQDVNDEGQSWTPVVVRILEATSSQKEKMLFLRDAAIYKCGSHDNILSLIGRSLETVPFLLLQEYCPQGDLKRYLQSNKAEPEKLLSTEYPLLWCCQLTSALKHLHERNIVHHDLASRNCQLSADLALKLGDYGLGPFAYPSDYYRGEASVPVRWRAPESLVCTSTTIEPKPITQEANVWSLAVAMWEICECGEQPYKALSDDDVVSQVLVAASVTLGRPTYPAIYTDYIFGLMKSCWTSPESRPSAAQIDLMLADLLRVHRNTSYKSSTIDEFDRRWESCKPNCIVNTDHIDLGKSPSPSMTNLHGSLDNLANVSIENELKTDLYRRTASSGSETEDENWRNKVERGAYTEKVRQKSRSVADLMVLTHVDYSESESETPLPSLDYRINYKNVRLANTLDAGNLTFGSEGNLLSVQDDFQEELRKLQEERRDSMPFVPDRRSLGDKEAKPMRELNDIRPVNRVYNVYNVTVELSAPARDVDCNSTTNGSEFCDSLKDDAALERTFDVPATNTFVFDSEIAPVAPSNENITFIEGAVDERISEIVRDILQNAIAKIVALQCNAKQEHSSTTLDNEAVEIHEECSYELPTSENLVDTEVSRAPAVKFDLSLEQKEAMPNPLTHSNLFTSTPHRKREISLPGDDAFSSIVPFTLGEEDAGEEAAPLNYSLETWDNFLGTTMDDHGDDFDSFNSEPRGLLVVDEAKDADRTRTLRKEAPVNCTYEINDSNNAINVANTTYEVPGKAPDRPLEGTFVVEEKGNSTFVKQDPDNDNENGGNCTFVKQTPDSLNLEGDLNEGTFENGGGWFLHPQPTSDLCGNIEIQSPSNTESYIGFGIDDEVMSAIRNELLSKLPHAQGGNTERIREEEDWDTCERNEVYLRYNVCTPLSPIPEESYTEEYDESPKPEKEQEEADWSGKTETLTPESNSAMALESPVRGQFNRHTPSQDSCCSNDTLFNLEELICAASEADKEPELCEKSTDSSESNKTYIQQFLANERTACDCTKPNDLNVGSNCNAQADPLNSHGEDSDTDTETSEDHLTYTKDEPEVLQRRGDSAEGNLESSDKENVEPAYENSPTVENRAKLEESPYVNVAEDQAGPEDLYENAGKEDVDPYRDYVNIVNMENDRNSVDKSSYIDIYGHDDDDRSDDDDNIYGILTDIRFTGPADNQMMSTSFSEEQEWESGSDSRSSSSGEFIWKEGEHEESIKTLRAAIQDALDTVKPMEGIAEDAYEESDVSSSFSDDEETPEFVPSAWDKFAMPSKSALRSPEKTLNKPEERKSKGVWFKKQKYHCIYEYPKEPESPIIPPQDLWKQSEFNSFADWEFDGEVFDISQANDETTNITNRTNDIKSHENLYQLTCISDLNSDAYSAPNADGDFFVTGSSQPFQSHSQFFPGGGWAFESATPDSGVEDVTPSAGDYRPPPVPELRQLAAEAVARRKQRALRNGEALGGLRHTRNRLKLDLPPSPVEHVVREKPAFTTFGKGRFMVQHVETPPDENVSFEALPYHPREPAGIDELERSLVKEDGDDGRCKLKIEVVRGEASLLDSGDEDSGIESASTLERKISNSQV
ncbi:unnamed protein product [Phyllotreta striolata]|uniref:Protein kinase domain-containing protein n=1 Tax=Phyllotreta striolata TaxID=444603 RepID=A0A9N9TFV3_PHYSR|nr:unnamed protein product [Phyllotreta striolata]